MFLMEIEVEGISASGSAAQLAAGGECCRFRTSVLGRNFPRHTLYKAVQAGSHRERARKLGEDFM